jgi:hypothetical protein
MQQFRGSSNQLAEVRIRFPRAVAALRDTAPDAPEALRSDVDASATDWAAINVFIQTRATQRDIDSASSPAPISEPLADWRGRLRVLAPWLQSHCPGDLGG